MLKLITRTNNKSETFEGIDKTLEFLINYITDENIREEFTPEVVSQVVATELEDIRKTLKEYEAL